MVREGDIALKLQIHVQRSCSIFSHCQTILFNCCEFCRIDVFFLQQCRWDCTKSQYFALVKHTCCTDIIFYGFVSKFCQQFPNSERCHKVPISCPTKMQNTVVGQFVRLIGLPCQPRVMNVFDNKTAYIIVYLT